MTETSASSANFEGLEVVAFESRHAKEMAALITRFGGVPRVAPALREVPLEEDAAALAFGEELFAGRLDAVIFMTGVGTRRLFEVLETRHPQDKIVQALAGITVVARGPKPVKVLRELKVPITITVPEPNTWREVLCVTEGRPERRIAVQEYGRANPELLEALRGRGAEVAAIRVYRYGLPEDTAPLREAARSLAAGRFQVALFTTAVQIAHLARIAREEGIEEEALAGLRQCFVGSIGPTTSEALEEFEVRPAFEPSHAKMGILVLEAARRSI